MTISPYAIPGLPNLRQNKADRIKQAVCDVTGFKFSELVKKGRKRERVQARMMICYLLRKKAGVKLTDIGGLFNYHHTSVIHCVDKFQDLLDVKDEGIWEDYGRVCLRLEV